MKALAWLPVLATLPWAAASWLLGLLLWACRLADKPLFTGPANGPDAGLLLMRWRPWAAERWRWSTTIGRLIVFHPRHVADADGPTAEGIIAHERCHVMQIEDMMTLSALLALMLSPALGWWSLLLWASGGMWQAPNWLTAWLRGGDAYRDSEHERSAYAQSVLVEEEARDVEAAQEWARMVEQLSVVASPEEMMRRRVEMRRWAAEVSPPDDSEDVDPDDPDVDVGPRSLQ